LNLELLDSLSVASVMSRSLQTGFDYPLISTMSLILGLALTVLLCWRARSIVGGTFIGVAGGLLVPQFSLMWASGDLVRGMALILLLVGPVMGGTSGAIASLSASHRRGYRRPSR